MLLTPPWHNRVVTPLQTLLVLVVGFIAGAMNAIVGAGTLLTFPALLALGLPPVTANVSNTLGLVPGSLAGAYGYRRELAQHRVMVRRLIIPSVLGGLVGAGLLLALPAQVFVEVVPVLLLLAAGLVALQPRLARRLAARKADRDVVEGGGPREHALVMGLVFAGGIYGGYFGAGFSVLMLAMFGIVLGSGLQAANGAKNLVAATTNIAATCVFIVAAQPNWLVAGLLAVSSASGALVSSRYGRRLPDGALRLAIIVVAVVSALHLWLT